MMASVGRPLGRGRCHRALFGEGVRWVSRWCVAAPSENPTITSRITVNTDFKNCPPLMSQGHKKHKGPPPRPKGMPKAEYRKKHARFFDNWFNTAGKQTNSSTTTSSVNVGGNGTRARNLRNARNALVDVSPDTGLDSNAGGFIPTPQSLTSVTSARPNKGLIFQQKEMFMKVYGDAGVVESKAYPVNPALRSMFPKGANIADNYERYRILSLEFLYVPLVSGMAPDGQQGRVVLSFGLDPLEPPPADLPAAESMDPNVAFMPFDRGTLTLNSAKLNAGVPFRWTRSTRNPAGTDLKTYDPGVLYVTVSGTTSSSVIGELHVVYTWELLNIRVGAAPILPSNNTYSVFRTSAYNFTSSAVTLASVDANAVGYAPYDPNKNGLGIVLDTTTVSGKNLIVLPPGRFFVTLTGNCVETAAWPGTITYMAWGFSVGDVGITPSPSLNSPHICSVNVPAVFLGAGGNAQCTVMGGVATCSGIVDSYGAYTLLPISQVTVTGGSSANMTIYITIQTA